MPDVRFYKRAGPFTLGSLTRIGKTHAAPAGAARMRVKDVAPLDAAAASDISFFEASRYLKAAQASRAGVIITTPAQAKLLAGHKSCLVLSDAPRASYARIAAQFYPAAAHGLPIGGQQQGVARSARLGKNVALGAGVVIGHHAEIGDNTHIGAHSVIGEGVAIGRGCRIGAHCVVGYALLGDHVILHNGVQLGQDGFGFVPSLEGAVKVPQLGRVLVQSHVELGANCTIDRGADKDTVIGEGTKLDNQIQLGHNVQMGQHCMIAAGTMVAGSVTMGDFVMIGGQSAIAGHVHIADGAQLAGFSAVSNNVAAGLQVSGAPARPVADWRREVAILARLRKNWRKT